jgi:hypothetical protein
VKIINKVSRMGKREVVEERWSFLSSNLGGGRLAMLSERGRRTEGGGGGGRECFWPGLDQ